MSAITANRRELSDIKASEVMSPALLTANEQWTVVELAQFLVSNGITGAPVVDEDEHLTGVVSVTDVARFASMEGAPVDDRGHHGYYTDSLDFDDRFDYLEDYSEPHMEATTVADIMTPSIHEVSVDTPLSEVASEMVQNGIHRVFVSDRRKIVGVVSALDILRTLSR
ncbi:MAG: CBS domain-containing protein [Pseudomonadota bacterium]|nr:CBS domain-containing protein [Pseudomonadota bacterium]